MANVILIMAYERDRYLRLCLESIRAAKTDDGWETFVSVDGPGPVKAEPLLDGAHPMYFSEHVGNLKHAVRSLSAMFGMMPERVLLLDEDHIVRTDALLYAETRPESRRFWAMSKRNDSLFSPLGNVFCRESFSLLMEYILAGTWIGTKRPKFEQHTLDWNYQGYDAVFYRYCVDTGRRPIFADKSYVGHIGVVGLNTGDDPVAKRIESEIFSCQESKQLAKAIECFKEYDHPGFVPVDFNYA